MAIGEVVDVIPMGHRLVPTARAVLVAGRVVAVIRRATRGIRAALFDRMLIDMVTVGMVKMALVQIVDMTRVQDRCMATSRPVHVIVSLVRLVRFHGSSVVGRSCPRQATRGNRAQARNAPEDQRIRRHGALPTTGSTSLGPPIGRGGRWLSPQRAGDPFDDDRLATAVLTGDLQAGPV